MTLAAAVGVERVLKKTCHQHLVLPLGLIEHVFGAVAVMHVEVNYGDALEAVLLDRVRRRHADIVEDAKSHRAAARGVVAAGAHRAKCVFHLARHHLIDRKHTGAGRAQRRVEGMRVHRRIRVKLRITLGRRVLENRIDIFGAMHPLQKVRMRERRFKRGQMINHTGGAHLVVDCGEAFRAFRMAGAHVVFQAVGVGDVGGGHKMLVVLAGSLHAGIAIIIVLRRRCNRCCNRMPCQTVS